MLQTTRNIILLNSQTLSVSGTTGAIGIPDGYDTCILYFNVGSPTGTTETLDMYIQQGFKAAPAATDVIGTDQTATTYTIWDDYAHFAQVTTSAGTQVLRIIQGTGNATTATGTSSFTAGQDAALAVSTVKAGPLGSTWRLKWVITGTLPVYPTTWMIGQFLPMGS